MKNHSLVAVLTLVVIAILSTPVAAQQAVPKGAPQTFMVSEPVSVVSLISTISEGTGATIVYDDAVPENLTFAGEIDLKALSETFATILTPHGYEAYTDNWTIHIRKAQGQPRTSAAPRTPQVGDRVGETPINRGNARINPALAGATAAGSSSLPVRTVRMDPASAGAAAAGSFPYVAPRQVPIDPYYAGANAAGAGYGYRGGYYNPYGYDMANLQSYGMLKIDGPDKFLQKVRVVIDGRDMGSASKANNSWNKPILMRAGNHVVEFVREEKINGQTQIVAFRRDVEVVPASVQISLNGRTAPTWLRVSGNEFDNARELYEYKQHRYIER